MQLVAQEKIHKTIVILIVFLAELTLCANERRFVYITPGDSSSQECCPIDQCYSLHDVISNQSFAVFDSDTTLELMPGRYNITQTVGQLETVNVSHFTLMGSMDAIASGHTDTANYYWPNATFGLMFVNTFNVSLVNIITDHCTAKIKDSRNCILDSPRSCASSN